jgi:RNA polymerase sigma-70 factor (ECF subfamily)
MDERKWLAEQFQAYRGHLRKVAYRMLGSVNEADDAVQESWMRITRTGVHGVENLAGWLTTVVGRVCLDMLRARQSRREEPLDALGPEPRVVDVTAPDPEQDAILADSVGLALLVVLEALTPAERVAYVLHDMFDLPFDDIAPVIGWSSEAARQIASRARRRVRGGGKVPEADRARQQEVVEAFFAASRNGDFDALIAALDPDVVFRADRVAARSEVALEIRGASAVGKRARAYSGGAPSTRLLLVNGALGAAWYQDGQPVIVFAITVEERKIVEIEMIAEPERLRRLDLAALDEPRDGIRFSSASDVTTMKVRASIRRGTTREAHDRIDAGG